ncbi:microspherule protein Rcd5 isoform X2 [Haemaphysalis longicornis]
MSSNLVLGNVVSDNSQDVSETSQAPESPPVAGNLKCAFSNSDGEPAPATILPAPHTSLKVNTYTPEQLQKRRSSSRSIKRKKFDDELVESSLIKTPRTRPLPGPLSTSLTQSVAPVGGSGATQVMATFSDSSQAETIVPVYSERKKTSKSAPKRVKKSSKNTQALVTKDLGRWKPLDDFSLVLGVQQTNDLQSVFRAIKFSCNFTLQEIKERWYALLYDPAISKMAVAAMKQLHPDVLAAAQARAIFSEDEELLLCDMPSTSQPTLEELQELLDRHPDIFMPQRTPKALFNHWQLMKQFFLLPDQAVPIRQKGDDVLSFSDAEEAVEEEDLTGPKDEMLEHELYLVDRNAKREMRQLENELPKWQVLVDSVTGVTPADFDNQTLAVLRGRLVRYLMRSKEITIGRLTKDNAIDVDLSLEGPAWKVSRRQGVIKLRNTGEFIMANEGKRPIYIDGKPVLAGNKHKLNNNSVVEIAGLRFIFLVNQDLISVIRSETPQSSCS